MSPKTVHLDTHVVVWLHAGALREISARAKTILESSRLVISPVVLLELDFLREVGRIEEGAEPVLAALASRIGLAVSDGAFIGVVESARSLTWTRDPFDRLIVGQSIAEGCSLVTKDRNIRKHHRGALW
jgi:PIN domain nuclease of toxin-antitoxin system